ncbi:MAG: hypothetical protein HOQ45_20645, partial [Nocardioidaceae bacterium]|nr:hypothetical protein [Nocardioidaceae bacterium]
ALRDCDAAILGTASPVAILVADLVVGAVRHRSTDLLLVDGCVPRNVDPRVRGVLGVTLLDIADLRSGDLAPAWSDEAAAAAGLVDAEVERLRRWWVRRASRRGSALDVEPVGL